MLGGKVSQKEAGIRQSSRTGPTGRVGNATPAQADPAGVSPEGGKQLRGSPEIDNVISSLQLSGYRAGVRLPQHKGDSKHWQQDYR